MIELIVEGKGLELGLRQMERSPFIKVIDPHVVGRYPGEGVGGQRIAVRVKAHTAAEARDLLLSYLPPDGHYSIRPMLI